ncbi:universal stress protein [Spirosoma sp. HMF3257]|uniref:Universal stress protein n=1 Tax=Spirosoma telluris TaxID=2183553 RepID=A0A327NNG4_9BACT|nr:universal stress protein [Spirosoma telluris]RAI75929.1 universal stress protein [Spirosoma telluris]
MKTILVPTDLSPMTDAVLSVAVGLARTTGAEIVLLHSVTYPTMMLTSAYAEALPIVTETTLASYEKIEEDARKVLDGFSNNPAYAGVKITPILLTNGQGLVGAITDQPADLIVMASKGASGLEELLIGSNAETVVRYAHCPVLVIKHPVAHFQPENIVCAVDVDDKLKSIKRYPFQMGEQGLHQFLYVITPTDNRDPDGVRDWVNDFACAKGITEFEFVTRHARNVPDGILEYAEATKADLIVLFTHGHKGLLHLLEGSVAEDVLNHANTPVLIMRA